MRYIGQATDELTPGTEYDLKKQSMKGKLFDGQNYKPDNRIMVWIPNGYTSILFYKVYESEEDIDKDFQE